jgi:hypothetical protein
VSRSTVFASDPSNLTIDVLTVGPGCALTLKSQNPTGPAFAFAPDPFIALANPTTVVSSSPNTGDIEAYTLQPNDTLVETVKDPGQLASPLNVAVLNGDVYTSGSAQGGVGPPKAQGFSFDGTAFTPLPGSPQTSTDLGSFGGAAVVGSSQNQLLAQADFSGQIGWYSLAGGGIAYTGDTPLMGSGYPWGLTVAGDNMLVGEITGNVEDCALGHNSVSNCHTIVTANGTNGGSLAIFK